MPEYRPKPAGKDKGGRPAWSALTMFKCVLLAKWFGLSDPQLEEYLKDWLSFRRFVGLSLTDATPDETTFVVFRKRLREAGLDRRLFEITLCHSDKRGLLIRDGTLLDATIIEQARGSKRDDSTSTRDEDASFTNMHGRSYHGYKGHIAADRSAIVTDYRFGTAREHDSQRIDELTRDERTMVVADAATGNGALSVAGMGSSLTVGNDLFVGVAGTGTLSVTGGGLLDAAGEVVIGDETGSNGTLTVTGLGSSIEAGDNIRIGRNGTGMLNVSDGASVSTFSGLSFQGNGSAATIDGVHADGTRTSVTVGDLFVNGSGSTLDITGGGLLQVATGGVSSAIGNGSVGTGGTVTVSGSDETTGLRSTLAFETSELQIGFNGGTGALSVLDGAALDLGTFTGSFAGGDFAGGNELLVGNTGGTGTMHVDGPGSIARIGSFRVGGDNSHGHLTVSNDGRVDISTPGTNFIATGSGASGLLSIQSGGQLNMVGALFVANNDANALLPNDPMNRRGAIVEIDGPGSSLSTSSISIGGNGNGEITLTNGASLNVTGDITSSIGQGGTREGRLSILSGSTATFASVLSFANSALNSSAAGRAFVDGLGSTLTVSDAANGGTAIAAIGGLGAGQLDITNGGRAEFLGDVRVGNSAGAGGSILINGAGQNAVASTMIVGGDMFIGNNSNGTITVSNGGSLEVNGAGTSILSASAGNGTITINSGGTATFAGTLSFDGGASVGGAGTVNLDGGTLTVGQIFQSEQDAQFNFTAGTLRVTDDISLTDSTFIQTVAPRNIGFLNGSGTSTLNIDAARSYEFLGNTTLEGNAHVLINGGNLTFGDLTRQDSADLDFISGTLTLLSDQDLDSARLLDLGLESTVLLDGRNFRVEATANLLTVLTLDGGSFFASTLTGIDRLDLISGNFGIGTLTVASDETFRLPAEFSSTDLDVAIDELNVAGILVGEAEITGRVTVAQGGNVRVGAGESLNFRGEGQAHINAGSIDITELANGFQGPARFEVGGTLSNASTGTISMQGFSELRTGGMTNAGSIGLANATAAIFADDGLMNVGNIIISNSTVNIWGDVVNMGTIGASFSNVTFADDFTNDDRVAISGQSRVTFAGDVMNNSADGFTVADGSEAVFFGSYGGLGIGGLGTVRFEGMVNIGFSPIDALFEGDVGLGVFSETIIELGGLELGAFDRFTINGDLTIDGGLAVSMIDGFSLGFGQEFIIFDTIGGLTGMFSGLDEGDRISSFGGVDLFISYTAGDGNDIALYSVPTPGSMLALALGGLAATRRRR